MPDALSLCVAIPTFGRDRILVETLEDLLPYVEVAGAELLVVDQTPQHDAPTSARLAAWETEGRLRVLTLQAPSLTRARNEALRATEADIVLFVDDDVAAQPALLQEHLEPYRDPSVAAVTGQVFVCRDPASPPPLEDPDRGTDRHFADEEPRDMDTVIGCNHSVRRQDALAIGGYDLRFVSSAHCEDFDVAQRLVLAGRRVRYNPAAWLVHRHAPMGGCRVSGSPVWEEWTNTGNLFLYAFRHGVRKRNVRHYLWRTLRTGPWRGENLRRPLRWPWAWAHWVRGLRYGLRHRHTVLGLDGPRPVAPSGGRAP